jgi:hypothetical protein
MISLLCRLFRRLATLLGAVIVGGALLVAILAPNLTPHDPFAQDLNLRLIPPVWMEGSQPAYLLGTDQIGRDYLSRLIYGTRISMLIGVLAVVTSGLIGRCRRVLWRADRRLRHVPYHLPFVDPADPVGVDGGGAGWQFAHAMPSASAAAANAQARRDQVRHRRMRDAAPAEERALALVGSVDQLVDENERARRWARKKPPGRL